MSITPFMNEPALELRRAEVRARATAALEALDARLPLDVPVLIGADERAGEAFDSVDPAQPSRVVARVQGASAAQADEAVRVATAAQPAWAERTHHERAEIVRRAAALLRSRRLEAAALALRECGKPWAEADADVGEAIDFLEYYALSAAALDDGRPLLQMPGERNALRYVGRGVAAVIAPWNFPLAIPTGMVSAALVTGNAVVLKPAEQSPACGDLIVRTLHDAGVPRDVLHLLPGGDEPGRALVAHPLVHTIAFTGSCAAGLSILSEAAKVGPEQGHLKKVVAEMGGKNCIIVDADADLDDAVPGILKSAFAFAGQKCSAASRVLVHEAIADELVARLKGAVDTLVVGPPEAFGTDVPPVIDPEAQERIARYTQLGGTPAATVDVPEEGFYAAPALFVDLPKDSPVVTDEIFGPVLSVERVRDVDHGLQEMERSRFALTGGLYSRSPATIAAVERRAPVGNLYVNQPCTGAMVGRQPFGGGRLSGTGPKAGGPDYLLQFVEARSVSEDTVRHGVLG
ncbi:aldehyde dehydrogenase family protein [Patulibacter sp. SYSU D01012]|uniref:aldehyde dehydrogenase family protein n=1 Tax=Patulibacter sp. SYSU D01012 TaxID=2817381 RepID=UPI001B301CF7